VAPEAQAAELVAAQADGTPLSPVKEPPVEAPLPPPATETEPPLTPPQKNLMQQKSNSRESQDPVHLGSPRTGIVMSSRRSFDEADEQSSELRQAIQDAIEEKENLLTRSPTSQMVPIARPWFGRQVEFRVGEQLAVLTDDGEEWMDAVVVAFFPRECEAEGWGIPAGTVKVSYELGAKWIMPKNICKMLQRKVETTTLTQRLSRRFSAQAQAGPTVPNGSSTTGCASMVAACVPCCASRASSNNTKRTK